MSPQQILTTVMMRIVVDKSTHHTKPQFDSFITGAQPKAGTGQKMQSVPVVFSTLHCEGYIADLRYIAGSLLLGVLAGSLKSHPPF